MKLKQVCITVLAAFCLTSGVFAETALPEDSFRLAGLTILDSPKILDNTVGNPLTTTRVTYPDTYKSPNLVMTYPYGLTIYSDESRQYIHRITVTEPGFTTLNGIQVGDSLSKVTKKYGKPNAVITKDGMTYYVYTENLFITRGNGRGFYRFYIGVKDNAVVSLTLTDTDDAFVSHPLQTSKDMTLGNLPLHVGMDYIRTIYGAPTKQSSRTFTSVYRNTITETTYWYGDSLEIVTRGNHIMSITTTKNNGWSAPGNITVGMDINDLRQAYGLTYAMKQKDGTVYYPYSYGANIYLGFSVKDNKIVSISLFSGGD